MKYFLSFTFVALALLGLWLLVTGRADAIAKGLDAGFSKVNTLPTSTGAGASSSVIPSSATAPAAGFQALEAELSSPTGLWSGSPFASAGPMSQYPTAPGINPLTGRIPQPAVA